MSIACSRYFSRSGLDKEPIINLTPILCHATDFQGKGIIISGGVLFQSCRNTQIIAKSSN